MKKTLAVLIVVVMMLLPMAALAALPKDVMGHSHRHHLPFYPERPNYAPVLNEITSDSVPATGDNSVVWMYGILAVIGLAGAAVVVRKAIAD